MTPASFGRGSPPIDMVHWALVLAPAALLAPAAARDIVTFDLGWKHRTGLHTWAKHDDRPPTKPDPGDSPAESKVIYDDTGWQAVQLPHDGLIASSMSLAACPDGCSGRSYLPRHVLWYRKQFALPAAWKGSNIFLDFEGSFRETTIWVNGAKVAYHDCGYTPFRVRLDNVTNVKFGPPGGAGAANTNVISIFVDPDNGDEGARDHGSGWWYEGGGLYRSATLVRTDKLHIEQDGLFAYSNLTWSDSSLAAISAPAAAASSSMSVVAGPSSAQLHTTAAVSNAGSTPSRICVVLTISSPDGKAAAPPVSSEVQLLESGASATVTFNVTVASPKLWSAASPALYTVAAAVHTAPAAADELSSCADGPLTDTLAVPHGFRSLHYDADNGFFLNREHFKVRGFCDHNTFAVVGMAVPARINLFRAQASRAVGGNGRRTSHNPPATSLLQMYDRVGIVVMDENRLFANTTKYVSNMGALVKRDRNHPSVVIWSFCNENGCEGTREKGGPRFQEITKEFDGTRPTLGNMFTFNDLLSHTIDVQACDLPISLTVP